MVLLLILQDWNDFMEWIRYPPGSMIFILLLSTLVALISTILTKLLTDTAEFERKQKIIKAHNEDKKKVIALAQENVEKYHKERKRWERRDQMLKKTQQGMALQRMKPTCLFFLPMIILFTILRNFYLNDPIAAPPMNPFDLPFLGYNPLSPGGASMTMANTNGKVYEWTELVYGKAIPIVEMNGWINFTCWYFLTSLGINTLIQRLLKIQTQASGGMEQMFSGQKAQSAQFPDV